MFLTGRGPVALEAEPAQPPDRGAFVELGLAAVGHTDLEGVLEPNFGEMAGGAADPVEAAAGQGATERGVGWTRSGHERMSAYGARLTSDSAGQDGNPDGDQLPHLVR